MKVLVIICALVVMVTGIDFADWHPQGDGFVRSPCPALNSLANHNVLPRNGRHYTVPMLVKALGEGLNVSAEIATTLATLGLSLSENPASGAFNLDDLNKHNAIEHDASLSRQDFDLGGNAQAFDREVFNETLSYFNGATNVGIEEVAAARWGRIQSSKANNSKFVYGANQTFPSYFESAGYFQLFKDPDTNKASVEWIKVFFEQERMPWKEGWRPSINSIDGFSIAQTILQLALHTPEKQ
ncbi:Chloroperoxidase [Phaeosphaeria sp. MPI-PUGE-AT-0046c]|nr:Chloroperoxidase [Phaeosphaeria sp. MPI-PUGE-AT-0046c]